MLSRHVCSLVVSVFSVTVVSGAAAQGQSNELRTAGYIGMVTTPLGSMAPIMHRDQLVDRGSPMVIHLRYGLRQDDSIRTHTAAATGEFRLGSGRASLTGGIQRGDSTTSAMGGLEYQVLMQRGMLTGDPTGPMLNLSFKLEMGFSASVEGALERGSFAAAMSVPMAVPLGDEVMFVPFVAPGLGFGMVTTGGVMDYEMLVLFGAGLVIHNPSRVDLTIGMHRTLSDISTTVFGIGLTWNR